MDTMETNTGRNALPQGRQVKIKNPFSMFAKHKNTYRDPSGCREASLLNDNSSFAAVEAYHMARTNLLFTRVDDGCQSMVFTSTYLSEGKSINCANLAIAMTQNGKKVLLMDADLRCPVVHEIFGLPNQNGLSEVLAGIIEREKCKPLATATPNLYVLPSGSIPPNPSELLSSKRMSELIAHFSEEFDYIMIDTPPLSVVTDAAVLSKLVQGYVLVVRAGRVPTEELQNVVARLERLGANILGFLLNDMDSKTGNKYGKYGSYGKYNKNYEAKNKG